MTRVERLNLREKYQREKAEEAKVNDQLLFYSTILTGVLTFILLAGLWLR